MLPLALPLCHLMCSGRDEDILETLCPYLRLPEFWNNVPQELHTERREDFPLVRPPHRRFEPKQQKERNGYGHKWPGLLKCVDLWSSTKASIFLQDWNMDLGEREHWTSLLLYPKRSGGWNLLLFDFHINLTVLIDSWRKGRWTWSARALAVTSKFDHTVIYYFNTDQIQQI